MTAQQLLVFCVLGATLILFIWNRWRYDVVAIMALMAIALAGLIPPADVFAGFGHPAVITVAAVLVLSQALVSAGVVDAIARVVWRLGSNTTLQVSVLTGIVIVLSGFMNNIGALALLMPVAITIARRQGTSPSVLLMPLAFGSLLGGMVTLIGTPPNIIIAAYREQIGLAPFRMFDFLPVGGSVAIAGLVFIGLIGWRLTPRRAAGSAPDKFFDISDYIAEVRIPAGSRFANRPLSELLGAVQEEAEVLVLGVIREGWRETMPSVYASLHDDDVLLIEADHDGIRALLDIAGAELVQGSGGQDDTAIRDAQQLDLREVIVTMDSPLVGATVTALDMRRRYGVNILAVARRGGQLREAIKRIRFEVGDILLVQGGAGAVGQACGELGCLPLAERGLRLEKPRGMLLTLGVFGAALALAALGLVPAAAALVAAALVVVLTGVLSPSEAYRSLDLPIIVLLAAMIPVGEALETSGGAQLIADGLSQIAASTSLGMMLAILMVATMLLSNVVNNAAAAILVAPISIDLAAAIGVSPDPFLMAVAVAASAAFLTPIGHQSCTLVMRPGGYRFGDYWRMGLPVSILVIVTAVPLILRVWPPTPL